MEEIKRFLIVGGDDEAQSEMKGVMSALQIQGASGFTSGKDALEVLEPKKIQFIVVFWQSSPMPGSVFIQKVKKMGAFRHVPILILSSKLSVDEVHLTAELEVQNVLPFPIEREKIQDKIRSMKSAEESLPDTVRKLRQAAGYLADGNIDEATNLVKECSVDKDYAKSSGTLLGEINFAAKKLGEAEQVLKSVVEEFKSFIPAKQILARVYSKNGKTTEAIEMLKKLAEYSPLSITNLLGLGNAYFEAGDMENAKQAYKDAEKIDSENDEVKAGLGSVAFKQGDFATAKEYLSSMEDPGDMVSSMNNVGIGLINSGQFEEGIKSYLGALEIMEGRAHLHQLQYNMGLGFKKMGQLDKAARLFAESLKTNPGFDKAYAAFVKLVKEMREKDLKPDQNAVDFVKKLRKKSA